VIGALVVLAILAFALPAMRNRRVESRRAEAQEHRERSRVSGIRAERETAAADEQAARARRQAAEAEERRVRARDESATAAEHAERARAIDPDVDDSNGAVTESANGTERQQQSRA
jgi:colicin import membrane protein